MRNCVLVFLGGVPAALAALEPPLWPLAFGINATEGYTGKGRSTVSYFYDSRIPAEKWVRPATGLHAQDNVCQGVDVPCADLVVGGYRWIIHPTRLHDHRPMLVHAPRQSGAHRHDGHG